jgi:type II secretory pathway component PulF
MPRFSYIARSATGERVQGSIEAPDKRSALVQIERQALFPVSVTEGGAAPAAPAAGEKPKAGKTPVPGLSVFAGKRPGRQPKMGVRDLLLFSRELSDLLQSGMTLGNALNTLSKRKMKAGQDIIVADLYVSMVRAGEVSGQVHEALLRLCVHYERVQEAREKVIGALTYPAIVLGAGFVTMIFTMLFVIPKFAAVFADLGSTLPLPTRILLGTSRFLLEWGWALVIVILLAIGAFRRWLKTEKGRFRWDGFELRMPIFKQIVSANAFAQFARTLGALLQNGVPVLQALSIVENTVGNAVIAGEIREARTRVTDGSTISGPLSAGKVFPPLLTDMLAVGEETGDMPAALANIARRYDTDLDRAVKVLTTVLEPILILLVAVLVGFVAISMLMAVFELTSGLKM